MSCPSSSIKLGACNDCQTVPGPRWLEIVCTQDHYGYKPVCIGTYNNSGVDDTGTDIGTESFDCFNDYVGWPNLYREFQSTFRYDDEYQIKKYKCSCGDCSGFPYETDESAGYAYSKSVWDSQTTTGFRVVANSASLRNFISYCNGCTVKQFEETYQYSDYYLPTTDLAYTTLMNWPFTNMPTGSSTTFNQDRLEITIDCTGSISTASFIETTNVDPRTFVDAVVYQAGGMHTINNGYLTIKVYKTTFVITGSINNVQREWNDTIGTGIETCLGNINYGTGSKVRVIMLPLEQETEFSQTAGNYIGKYHYLMTASYHLTACG